MARTLTLLTVMLVISPHPSHAGRLARKARVKLEETKETIEEKIDEKINLSGRIKYGAKSLLSKIPGGELFTSIFDGGGMEAKVDRIDKRQKTSLDRIREIAQEAIQTKKKVEEMYYFKKRSQEEASFLAKGLQKGSFKKFLGGLVENGLQIPINPAEYIPNIPYFKKLKENLALDLSLEKNVLGQGKYLLSHTRASLLSSNFFQTSPQQFDKQYAQAEAYEAQLHQALKAKKVATVKIYKAEIDRLEKEIKLLEAAKAKPGLTVSDVMQMELVIDSKRRDVRELNEKVDDRIAGDLELDEEEKEKMAIYKATRDLKELDEFLEKDRQRVRTKYGHLWKF